MNALWVIVVLMVALFISSHGLFRTMIKWKQEGVLECSMPYCTSPTESSPTPLDDKPMEGIFIESLLFVDESIWDGVL